MADGKITGRVIRHHLHMHRGKETGTLFITFVKSRGTYRTADNRTERAASDFLTFEYFMDGSQAAQNRADLLMELAEQATLVEIEYNLKSRSYTDKNNEKVFKEYKQLQNFDILESKQAVADRLSHRNQPEESEESKEVFDPNAAGAFIEQHVEEHLVDHKPTTKDEGRYGNPFK